MYPLTGVVHHSLGFADSDSWCAQPAPKSSALPALVAVGCRRVIRLQLDPCHSGVFFYQDMHHCLILTFFILAAVNT